MRFVLLSDTHDRHRFVEVPDGDIVIHSGDFCTTGEIEQVESFAKWFGSLPHKHKLVVPGNHDRSLHNDPFTAEFRFREAAGRDVRLLKDERVEIEGIVFYGSPWTPVYGTRWAFHKRRGEEMANIWRAVPLDTQVLITHGPAHGVMDFTKEQVHAGCEELGKKIKELPNLRLHTFGHIHEGYGIREWGNLISANASICNRSYHPANAPHVFDLEF